MNLEVEENIQKIRRNSLHTQIQQTQKLNLQSEQTGSLQQNTIQRSNSYDNIRDLQTNNSSADNKSNSSLTEQNQVKKNINKDDSIQYEGNNKLANLFQDTQKVISQIDKISVLLESQQLLKKLHQELENLVLRNRPFLKSQNRSINCNTRFNLYKAAKQSSISRSRSRSNDKKKSSRVQSTFCYSPSCRSQKNSCSSNKYSGNIFKHKIEDDLNNDSKRIQTHFQGQEFDKENIYIASSSDSNSPLIGSENNNIEDEEQIINSKLEKMNFKCEYSPKLRRRNQYYDEEQKRKSRKVIFYLNNLEEKSEEEEDQDSNTQSSYKDRENLFAKKESMNAKIRDDSFDQHKKKHEIEQLNEILKNLSIDIQNEVIKAQQQKQSQIQSEEDQQQNSQVQSTNQSNTPNIFNINSEQNSFKPNKPSDTQAINNQQIQSSVNFSPQKYKFKSVEAGMDYVIRKLQNL